MKPVVERGWLPLDVAATLVRFAGFTKRTWEKRRSGDYHGIALHRVDLAEWPEVLSDFDLPAHRSRTWLTVLRMKQGSHVVSHLDGLVPMTEQRIVMLQPAVAGGILTINNEPFPLEPGDSCLFDGNKDYHEVTSVEQGERLVHQVLVSRG